MRILFIGDLSPNGNTYQRKIALEETGNQVTAYSTNPKNYEYYTKGSLVNRIFWKLGFPIDYAKINDTLLREVKRISPHVIWIEKGNSIYPQSLKIIKQKYPKIKLVSASFDDMFAFHNRSWYYTWGIKYYDIVFTTKSYNCHYNELPSLGAKRVVFVDNSYDIYTSRPIQLTEEEYQNFGADVSFIGSFEEDRANSILFLAANGIKVRVWGGGGWHKWKKKHPNLIIENVPLFGDDFVRGICSSKINLGFLRKINRDQQTARSIEIPACGAFMLAERTNEHLALFKEDKEAAFFGNNDELLEKVKFYLVHDQIRREIANAGRERCLKGGYSYHHRARKMLSIVAGG